MYTVIVTKDVDARLRMQVKVAQIIAPVGADGDAQLLVNQLLEAGRTFRITDVIEAVNLGDGVGQDVHTIGLVMKDLARFLTGLHITGRIGYELSEGDGAVLFKGIASWLRPFTLWHVHRFGVAINNSGIGRWDFALLNGDAQDAGKDGLGSRGHPKLLVALDAVVPLGDQSPAANDGDAVAPLLDAVVKPAFGAVKLLGIYACLPGRCARPVGTRVCSSGHKDSSFDQPIRTVLDPLPCYDN